MFSLASINLPLDSQQIINIQLSPSTRSSSQSIQNSLYMNKDASDCCSSLKNQSEKSKSPMRTQKRSPLRDRMLRKYREKAVNVQIKPEKRQKLIGPSRVRNNTVKSGQKLADLKLKLTQAKMINRRLKREKRIVSEMGRELRTASGENLELKKKQGMMEYALSNRVSTAMEMMEKSIYTMLGNKE